MTQTYFAEESRIDRALQLLNSGYHEFYYGYIAGFDCEEKIELFHRLKMGGYL
jgi:hypothetical protein